MLEEDFASVLGASIAEMVFAEPPSFDALLQVIGELEQRVNTV